MISDSNFDDIKKEHEVLKSKVSYFRKNLVDSFNELQKY